MLLEKRMDCCRHHCAPPLALGRQQKSRMTLFHEHCSEGDSGTNTCAGHHHATQSQGGIVRKPTCSCSSRVGIIRAASREERGKSAIEGAGPSSGMTGVEREGFSGGPITA